MTGTAGGGPNLSEVVRGTIVFGPRCSGHLEELKNVKAPFETTVDSKGESRTRVWKTAIKR
jgi:hypothetical protein